MNYEIANNIDKIIQDLGLTNVHLIKYMLCIYLIKSRFNLFFKEKVERSFIM
jgi:hypothetical protein